MEKLITTQLPLSAVSHTFKTSHCGKMSTSPGTTVLEVLVSHRWLYCQQRPDKDLNLCALSLIECGKYSQFYWQTTPYLSLHYSGIQIPICNDTGLQSWFSLSSMQCPGSFNSSLWLQLCVSSFITIRNFLFFTFERSHVF